MVGETPNIDRIGQEGSIFMDYVAMQSCTSGRNAFFTGMYSLRTGMIPPQLPGSPSYLRPGTPALAKFLLDLGYTTGEFGKNHLGDHTEALSTAHGFQEYWGYLYHLDAMQEVSFPDINKTATTQAIVLPVQEHADPRRRGGARCRRSSDDNLSHAATPGADGGVTPFKAQKGEAWEVWHRPEDGHGHRRRACGSIDRLPHDWNLLPIGQQLGLRELESYQKLPPLQAPESYNFSQVMDEVKKANANTAGD